MQVVAKLPPAETRVVKPSRAYCSDQSFAIAIALRLTDGWLCSRGTDHGICQAPLGYIGKASCPYLLFQYKRSFDAFM